MTHSVETAMGRVEPTLPAPSPQPVCRYQSYTDEPYAAKQGRFKRAQPIV